MPQYIVEIADSLKNKYHDFAHYNRKNPLDELLFILLSVKTTQNGYRQTYRKFQRKFPSFDSIAKASRAELAKPLIKGGLYKQKSLAIKSIFDTIISKFGKPTLAPLKKMSLKECEDFLTSLPGVGKKVARCVMLYSLDFAVFPVDTHCWRICKRIGWVRPTKKDKTCSQKDMDRLQNKIPENLRFTLHVNMVSHGREICVPKNPKCDICPINMYCRKIGLR